MLIFIFTFIAVVYLVIGAFAAYNAYQVLKEEELSLSDYILYALIWPYLLYSIIKAEKEAKVLVDDLINQLRK